MRLKFAGVIGLLLLAAAGCESHDAIDHQHAKSAHEIPAIEAAEGVSARGARR